MHRLNWDDLRFVLEVAETGSISAAARKLKVNHATVLRRVAQFEEAQGGPLFERGSHGYKLLAGKEAVIMAAREAREAMLSVRRAMQGDASALSGAVRLSSTDTFCQVILPAFVSEVNAEVGRLNVELMCSNDYVDFTRLEADIAVRPALSLPETLIGMHAADLAFSVYAAPEAGTRWLGLGGALQRSRAAVWLKNTAPKEPFVAKADSFLVLRALAAQGVGQAVLPCCLGDNDPNLERRSGPLKDAQVPIWVLSHKDLRQTARLREVRERLNVFLADRRETLLGLGG